VSRIRSYWMLEEAAARSDHMALKGLKVDTLLNAKFIIIIIIYKTIQYCFELYNTPLVHTSEELTCNTNI
jgi:hypothetical protein